MKILFCCDSLNQGGAEKQMALLAILLLKEGHNVTVWSLHNGVYANILTTDGIKVVTQKNSKSHKKIQSSVYHTISTFKPDVIHIWGTATLLICFRLFFRTSIPIVNGFIRFGVLSGSILNRIRVLTCARIGDLVVANSQAGLTACRVNSKKGRILPNGFDWSRLPTEFTPSPSTNVCNVVMCANITRFKNYPLLVDTAILASKRNNSRKYRFLFIGRPIPSYEIIPIRNRAADLIKSGVVQLIGGVDNPFSYLLASDIGILLSTRGEGISNSIMEYMAAKLPVICTNAGGNTELIDSGCGILIEEDKPDYILKKLDYLYDNTALRKQMGENGFQKIHNNYSTKFMLDKSIQIYKEVIQK